MRVCIIGNSHLAALKQGSEAVARDDVSLTFFGTHGDTILRTEIRDGQLVARDQGVREKFEMTGGEGSIDLSRYDAFVLVGMGFGLSMLLPVFATHTLQAIPLDGRHVVSVDSLGDAAADLLRITPCAYVYRLLRTATPRPIFVVPEPALSEVVLEQERGAVHRAILAAGQDAVVAGIFREAARKAFGPDALLVEQPEATLASAVTTQQAYGEGSVRLNSSLDDAHSRRDVAHMNAAYGRHVLKVLISRMTAPDLPQTFALQNFEEHAIVSARNVSRKHMAEAKAERRLANSIRRRGDKAERRPKPRNKPEEAVQAGTVKLPRPKAGKPASLTSTDTQSRKPAGKQAAKSTATPAGKLPKTSSGKAPKTQQPKSLAKRIWRGIKRIFRGSGRANR